MLDKRLFITIFNSIYDTHGTRLETSFEDICESLSVPQVVNTTLEEYEKLSKKEQNDLKFGNAYCPAVFKDDIRTGAVDALAYLVVIDADHPTATLIEDMKSNFKGVAMCCHSTFRSREDNPRYRFLIEISRTLNKEEYKSVLTEISRRVGCDLDEKCFVINQPILFPKVLKDVKYHYEKWGTKSLDVDELLGNKKEADSVETENENANNPSVGSGAERKPYGWIQAWCDVHPIKEIVEEKLNNVYEPTDVENRYKYIGSDSTPGVIINPEKNILTSFHDSDPASGKSYNSFDLYRIHTYGHLDKDTPTNTPKNELLSFKTMMKYIKKDKKAKELLIKHLESVKPKKSPEIMGIMYGLQRDSKGERKNSVANVSDILIKDPNLKGIYWNSFFGQFEVNAPLPWETDERYPHPYNDHHRNSTINYISRTYELEVRSNFDTALSELVFKRSVNPLQDYFLKLHWDGVSRVKSLLQTYLGCEDTEYTRAAMRITLIGAVKRVFEPACKFETVLLILGEQGSGKSTFVSKLGMNYYTDSIRLQDIVSKTAAEKLRGIMIVELGEMAGYSKTEVETFKSFISCVDDQYREPYAKCKSSHPRTNIFIATSNKTTGLLTDETGNRRILPVYTTDNHTLNSWDMSAEDVDQIWAEAFTMYKNGESSEMPKHLLDEIRKMQDGVIVEDERSTFIAQYLEILLPDNWYDLSTDQRRDYISRDGSYTAKPYEGTNQRKYVCAAEICTELFNLKMSELTPRWSKDIALMIRKLGWTVYPHNNGRKKIPGYGTPTVYCRPSDK